MTEQAKRLQLAREHAGYKSGRMAALRMGWKYPTYAAHESGWRVFPPKVAQKYARAFDVHPDFLLFGTRPPEWYTSAPQLQEVSSPIRYMALFQDEEIDQIYQHIMAGVDRRDFCIADLDTLPPRCFALRMMTDELEGDPPGVKKGDILIFEPRTEPSGAGAIVVLSVTGQTKPSVRKARVESGGKFKYAASNENYDPILESDARVFGQAVQHIRRL
jgi:hypothetical protein